MGFHHYYTVPASPRSIGKSRTKMFVAIFFILIILTIFGIVVAAASGAFNKPNEQKNLQKTAINSSSQASSQNTNIQVIKIENKPKNDDQSKNQQPMVEQWWRQMNNECSKVKINYATYVLSVVFGIVIFLQLLAALFFLVKAAIKDRKLRKEKKKHEKSLFRKWLANQEKQDVEKQEPKQNKQEIPENSADAAQEAIISQKQEIDQIRVQATRLLRAINSIPVEIQLNPNAAPQQSNQDGK